MINSGLLVNTPQANCMCTKLTREAACLAVLLIRNTRVAALIVL